MNDTEGNAHIFSVKTLDKFLVWNNFRHLKRPPKCWSRFSLATEESLVDSVPNIGVEANSAVCILTNQKKQEFWDLTANNN